MANFKVAFVDSNSIQYIRTFPQGSDFQTIATVLWDERVDGPMPLPDNQVGGYVVSTNNGVKSMTFNQSLQTTQQTTLQAAVTAEQTTNTQIQTLITQLKAYAAQGSWTAADVLQMVVKLLQLKILKKEI